ncbi:MAG: hypothetical protein CM15mV129_220 [uncultured marine virus]|nr:MAG: hypothetical protein CM15mV129_220 [uncultured marine virus]
MYNLMDKLEAENDQSQGLDGARKMFKTAQRLEKYYNMAITETRTLHHSLLKI